MGVTTLLRSGLIYEDKFDSTTLDSRWEILPNDPSRYSLTDVAGSLRLKHGADPLYLFFSDLTNEKQFVLDVKNSYNPLTDGDVGGIVVFASADDNIVLEEYFDNVNGTTESYPWIRLVRDYNTYSAYWSIDGAVWNLIGSQDFDILAPKIGLFIRGATGESLDVEEIRVFRLPKLTLSNVTEGVRVDLTDTAGAIVDTRVCRTNGYSVQFDLLHRSMPFTGKFIITLKDGTTTHTSVSPHDFWGGDEYRFELSLDLYFMDDTSGTPTEVKVSTNVEQFLGYLNNPSNSYKDILMILRNPYDTNFSNITVQLTEYNGNQFARLIDLAMDNNGTPGTFIKTLSIASIDASADKRFWARIQRESDPSIYQTDVYFGIKVASQTTY